MLKSGEILQKRYRLETKLGQNAGRQTWRATDLQTEEPAVVKLLAFGGDVDWEQLKLFEREGQILRQLNHAQIPQYRDYFALEDRNLWFGLVQGYIPGLCLKDSLAQRQRFDEAAIRKIATEVLEVLTYLHGLNPTVLHRDIKPSNLIWGEDDRIYLVDLGAVQDRAVAEGATFTVVGTYGYAPMEQFGGRSVPASDLYALGATLIHLLTGVPPADLPQKDLQMQFRDRVTASDDLIHWLAALTQPDVTKRPGSAKEAQKLLEEGVQWQSRFRPMAEAESLARFKRPQSTRLKLHRSSKKLLVQAPGYGLGWLLVTAGCVLFFVGISQVYGLLGGMLILLVGAVLAGLGLYLELPQQLEICFLPYGVQIRRFKRAFGVNLPSFSRKFEQILTVFHVRGNSPFSTSGRRDIMMQTLTHEHRLLESVSWKDATWAVQEIKDWLEGQ